MISPAPHTPRQLFRLLDGGEITREQFREAMAQHAESLIEEMVEVHENPVAAWLETLRNRRAAAKLIHRHSEPVVRELLLALSEVPDFPLANWLWNADHTRLPLYCFLRSRREPIFRILKITSAPFELTIQVEYGSAAKGQTTREMFIFGRDRFGRLKLQDRSV